MFDDPTAMHIAYIVKEIGYPIMVKASDGDTVLDEKNVSPINAEHSESINYISKLANSETKFTETNISTNYSTKIPATKNQWFFMGKLSVKNFDVSDSKPNVKNSNVWDGKPIVLAQPLNHTNYLVFKLDINYKQVGTVSRTNYLKRDLMIFHQNVCLFIYFSQSIDPN